MNHNYFKSPLRTSQNTSKTIELQEHFLATQSHHAMQGNINIDVTKDSPIPIKRHVFCQTPLYNSGVTRFESWTISHTFAVILAATAPPPRWRRKPWKGLLSCLVFLAKSVISLLQFWKHLVTFRWFVAFSLLSSCLNEWFWFFEL